MSSAAGGPPHRPEDGPDRDDGSEPTSPIGPPPPGWGPSWQPGWQGEQPGFPGGQQGFQAGQPGWQQPYGYGYGVPDHPRASTSMVLGIIGLVLCQVVSPFAWVTARRTLQEIDAAGGRWGGRGQAQAGYVLGIVGTVILGLGVVGLVVWLLFGLVLLGTAGNV